MIVTQQLGPWSKGCLSVCSYQALVCKYTMYLSKFNYNVIFAASTLFHFVLFWYNQLNFLKLQWRIQDGIPPGCKPKTGFWRPWANWRMAPLGGGVGWGKGARCSKWSFLFQIGIRLLEIALTLNWLVLNACVIHAKIRNVIRKMRSTL